MKMAVQEQENVVNLYETVLGELEKGIQLIGHHFPPDSFTLEIKEALVNSAEILLEVSVLLEPLLSEDEAVTEVIWKIVSCLEAVYEEELRSMVVGSSFGGP